MRTYPQCGGSHRGHSGRERKERAPPDTFRQRRLDRKPTGLPRLRWRPAVPCLAKERKIQAGCLIAWLNNPKSLNRKRSRSAWNFALLTSTTSSAANQQPAWQRISDASSSSKGRMPCPQAEVDLTRQRECASFGRRAA